MIKYSSTENAFAYAKNMSLAPFYWIYGNLGVGDKPSEIPNPTHCALLLITGEIEVLIHKV
jgi:hypothetical protein